MTKGGYLMDLRDLTIAEYKEFIKGYQKPYGIKI